MSYLPGRVSATAAICVQPFCHTKKSARIPGRSALYYETLLGRIPFVSLSLTFFLSFSPSIDRSSVRRIIAFFFFAFSSCTLATDRSKARHSASAASIAAAVKLITIRRWPLATVRESASCQLVTLRGTPPVRRVSLFYRMPPPASSRGRAPYRVSELPVNV